MKKILILGAGIEQSIAIKEAKKLGYYIIACDSNSNAEGFLNADVKCVIDIQNIDEVFNVAKLHDVDGIFTHGVEIPHIVSAVSEKLNLPSLSLEVAERATNKKLRISYLKSHGIPCADFKSVKDIEDLLEKASELSFPLVIKPIDVAGSRGVRVVEHPDDLIAAYYNSISFSKSKEVLLEEKLSGPEISTESVVYNDQIITFGFADRNYCNKELFAPYFIEDGINFPSILSIEIQKSIIELVEKTIKCLGINFGAAKGDIIIHNGVPKIIEMAARTSGGWFGAGSIPLATGSNMLKPLIQMAVGDKPDLEALKPNKKLGCAQRYIIPIQDGKVISISGVDEALSMPGIAMAVMFLPNVGDEITKAKNHAQRFGQIICTANTREEAIDLCENAIKKINVSVK